MDKEYTCMQKNTYIFNERGTVLMMVIIASIILSIIGIASISLSGLQQIAARAEVDVQRANAMADAGLEYGKMWISSRCISTELFPENLTVPPPGNQNSISLGTISFGSRGSCAVSITPDRLNDVDLLISSKSVIGTYTISSTATISTGATGTMDTTKNKTCQVRLWYTTTFSSGPVMNVGRSYHTATLLPSGKVLVAGGSGALASAELYNPTVNSFATTGSMGIARVHHTATLTLLNTGKVLIAGGSSDDLVNVRPTAELFDPAGNGGLGLFVWTGPMFAARYYHTGTILPTGYILVTGGIGTSGTLLTSAELFDPAGNAGAGSFTQLTAVLSIPLYDHVATLLLNGKVLIAGGITTGATPSNAAGLYSVGTAANFTPTGLMNVARYDFATALLPTGKVLVAGGANGTGILSSAELFDPAGNGGIGSFSATGSMSTARLNCTATLLPNGKVLVVGSGTNASTDLYDPAAGTFSPVGSLSGSRLRHTSTLLLSGKVLVAGGDGSVNKTNATDLFRSMLGKPVDNSYIEGPVTRTVH